MGIAGLVHFEAGAGQYVEGAAADGCAGDAVAVAGVPASGGNSVEPGHIVVERTLPAGGDAAGRLVLEPAQPDGIAIDARVRRGLQHLYATRATPASREPFRRAPFRWPGPAVVRRDGGGRVRLALAVHE